MDSLKTKLSELMSSLTEHDKAMLKNRLKDLVSVFPFNEYEYMLIFLRDRDVLTFDEYEKIRSEYVTSNKYLNLYGLSPRVFGEIWGQEHLRGIDKRFQKPSKEADRSYDGEYDLWVEGIKTEVKACRAINTKKRGDLVSKALRLSSTEPFWMNFQQLKPDSCDIFIFIGVWVDQIIYWVLDQDEVKDNDYISHQHRGGIEYQIGVTHKNISKFEKFRVESVNLVDTIIKKHNKRK
ncbi:MAG: hypothetical protein Q7S42_05035 [Candidatus Omnitrophota bacterium]|nr:hypothetical protein [Candidatus Omnitrophota bacterium]